MRTTRRKRKSRRGRRRMPQMNPKLARRKQKSKRGKKGSFMRIATTGAGRK